MACVLIQNSRRLLSLTQANLKDVQECPSINLIRFLYASNKDVFTKDLGLSSWSCRSMQFPMLVFVSDQTISKVLGSGSILLTDFGRATATFMEQPQPTLLVSLLSRNLASYRMQFLVLFIQFLIGVGFSFQS